MMSHGKVLVVHIGVATTLALFGIARNNGYVPMGLV